ncbi:MAG TPA: aminotransferase class I/II-fold pyridoxal phosphate-dependent enzyme, partial [Vicinamibacterales bacterium]|nr:aminotransferase class I/II-fold pyridoxal phosphate-dependent enzyme [Vicinamibacterales bacterium]
MTSRAGTRVPRAISLNLNVRGLGPSATLAIKARCRALRAEGREVFDFGLGQSPFPVPDPVVRALQQAAAERDYLPIEGLPALRAAVAGFHQRKDGFEARPEGVLVGPGSKELMFLLQLVFYGEIILRSPCWVSYLPQAQIIGRRITVIPTSFDDAWKITPALLHDALAEAGDDGRPRLLVMNYPSNPTGHTYTVDELAGLAEVARAFDLIVLSDEIYAQTQFNGGHVSVARFCPERTIVSSGLSK